MLSGVPTSTGPAPPMPAYRAKSRSVHFRFGSASVKLWTIVRMALVSMYSSGWSGAYWPKSMPLQPLSSASPPS